MGRREYLNNAVLEFRKTLELAESRGGHFKERKDA